jgi:hypothetical protein
MIAIALVLQLSAASYAAMPGVDSMPRDPVIDSLRREATRFMMTWRREWTMTRQSNRTYPRMASLHCHFDGSREGGAPNIIRALDNRKSFCPVWFPLEDSLEYDEGVDGVDAALIEESRRLVQRARRGLLERLQAAAETRTSHPWLVGQVVRFAVDQKDTDLALRWARGCSASRSWCLLLEGYALHSARRIAPADSAFQRGLGAMKPSERCEWSSIAQLLDIRAKAAYERLDCASRDSLNAVFWWLADPLYIEPGNERRAEHFARLVRIRLHAALTVDERWDWREKYGADALAAMLVRYGWPSHLYWAGSLEDNGHFQEFLFYRDSSITVAPEYGLPRYHSTPPWRAVLDPSTLTRFDLERFAPRLGYGAVDWENDFWPREHANRLSGPVLDLPEQLVIFRRDNDALLAVGLDVPQKFFKPGVRTPYDAAIIAARDANDRWVPSRESIVLDGTGTTILTSPLATRAQVISAELAPADGADGLAVRARRAVLPPAPLSVLPTGETAISDPLFFRPLDGGDVPDDARTAIGRMFGGLTFSEKRLGVFWETYGIAPTDTVEIRVRIIGNDRPGFFRRLGTSARILQSTEGGMAITWRELRVSRPEAVSWAGDVPIVARSIVVDVSRLRPGRYTLEVGVAKRATATAMTRREITIVK